VHVTYLFFLFFSVAWSAWSPVRGQQGAYNEAVVLLNAGDVDQAEVMFRLVLRADTECGLAQHGLGLSLLRQDQVSEARSVFEALVSAHPDQADAHVGVSLAAFAMQDFGRARSAAQQAVERAPGSLEAVSALVGALLREGAVGDAEQAVARAQGQVDGPSLSCLEAQVLLEAGRTSTAQQRLSYCRQSTHAELSAAVSSQLGAATTASAAGMVGAERLGRLSEAVTRLNAGDAAGAVAILDPIVASDDRRADARLIRARARHRIGDIEGARADLEAAFEGGSWVDVHRSGAMSGILRQSHADALQAGLAEGAALLVQIHLESGDVAQGEARLATARAELGDSLPLSLAEARIKRASGAEEEAWAVVLRWSQAPEAMDLIAEWAIDRPGAVPEPALAALASSGRWNDRYNLSIVQYKQKQYPRCLQTIEGARERTMDPGALRELWLVGYRCAVHSEDLASSDRMYSLLRGAPVRESDRVNHARLRLQSGEAEGALSMLRGLEEPAVQPLAAAISVRAHATLGQWSEATAASTGAAPRERHWLGGQLAAAGQLSAARRVLTSSCQELPHEDRVRCSQLLSQLGGPL
jgi:tetratricopeptide (TPR) repeat protein